MASSERCLPVIDVADHRDVADVCAEGHPPRLAMRRYDEIEPALEEPPPVSP